MGKEHTDHLVRLLKEKYEISKDWGGKIYIGLKFDWDYSKRQVHVSMPGCVNMALIRFKHRTPKRRKDQPYQHVIPNYGAKIQYAVGPDGTALLNKDNKKFVQQVTGTFMYYARAVESTTLVTLSEQASLWHANTMSLAWYVITASSCDAA